jgi:sirohydrochlorin cobaltochelatase
MDGAPLPASIGVLVVGHGTADPLGAGETHCVAGGVAGLLAGVPVELGFLEVIGPTIAEAVDRLAARGCREVVVAPLLLFAAGHAKRDVPEAVTAAAARHGMAVRQADALGCEAAIIALSAARRREACTPLDPVAPEEVVLVVLGRGSSDPTSPAQLQEFVEATLAGEPRPRRVEFGFAAAARPRLDEAIAAACDPADAEVRRIVVQPHLLFRGHVEDQVTAAVAEGRRLRPDLEWVQVPRLGADPLVARAAASRVAEVLRGESLSRQG